MKDDMRISPCGGCRNLRSMCSPPRVTAPFFPPGSEADFPAVRHRRYRRTIDTIANHQPELARAINLLIRVADASRDHSARTRLHCLVNAAITLTDLLRRVADLPTEPVPGTNIGNGDLFICRGEPAELAARCVQKEPFSSEPGIRLSAPTAINDDDRDN